MGTNTTRLGLHKPDPTDAVNVVTDINNNMDTLDSTVGVGVTSALPSSPFQGRLVSISTDGFRQYFWTGSAWVEVLNSSGTFGSDVKIAAANKLIIGADVNLYRSAANVLKTDDSLTVAGTLTVGNVPMSPTVLTSASATTNTTTGWTTVNNLSFSCAAGALYKVEAYLRFQVSINTLNPQFAFNCPASPTFINYVTWFETSTGHGAWTQAFDGPQQGGTGGAPSSINTDLVAQIQGLIKPSAAGTITTQISQATAVGTLTAKAGSFMIVRQLA